MDLDEHVMEALGRTKVVIRGGVVVEVGEPMIRSCPLAKRFEEPVYQFSKDAIKRNIENRIKKVGMFTKDRIVVSDKEFVPFGASELISCGMRQNLIQGAVIVCDGAGTVITSNPLLVQGIGGRMSGLVKTSPIQEVIDRIEEMGGLVLNKRNATIDQVNGVEVAYQRDFIKVAVTVVSAKEAEAIRSSFKDALIFATHLTGISKEEAERLAYSCDLITGCASRWVREVASRDALLQAGSTIPVFAMTDKGKDLIVAKIKETKSQLFVKLEKLPYFGEKRPDPLV
ncbi:MAG: methanogenesis marker 8 protein [Candidatus Methanomethylicaceae archaeon]